MYLISIQMISQIMKYFSKNPIALNYNFCLFKIYEDSLTLKRQQPYI